MAFNSSKYNIEDWLIHDENGILEKIANTYNNLGQLIEQVKTRLFIFPVGQAGQDGVLSISAPSLSRSFIYDAYSNMIPGVPEMVEWTQALEDIANAVNPPVGMRALSILKDGINDYSDGGDIVQFDIANAFSISLWVKPDNIAGTRILFSKAGPGPDVDGYMLRHNATTGALFLQLRTTTTNRSFTYNLSLVAGVWQHVVFTYAGGSNISGAHTYKDGVKSNTPGSGSLGGTMLGGWDFFLGQRNSSFHFSGNFFDTTVWNKELSQVEVDEIYNSGVPIDPTAHSAQVNLVNWWKMGDGDTYPILLDNKGADNLTMINMSPADIVGDVP